jgi:hypothetical protein
MSFERDVKLVFQSLLDENKSDYRMALWDLAHRYVHAVHGYSPGYARTAAIEPAPVKLDVPASDVTSDDWLVTAREG